MSFIRSVCEEFCDSVDQEVNAETSAIELKCSLQTIYFTPLMERMNQLGYTCVQVQRDIERKKCFAWFQEMCLNS